MLSFPVPPGHLRREIFGANASDLDGIFLVAVLFHLRQNDASFSSGEAPVKTHS